jgi:uncharacterized protein YbaP (TraB family)
MLAARGRSCLLLALLVACAGQTPCKRAYPDPATRGAPFLWTATRGEQQVTLLGSYHAASGGDVPDTAWAALDGAAVFMAELDPDDEVDEQQLRLPRGQSLEKLLSADDFTELAMLLELAPEALAPLKPWVAMALLTQKALGSRPPAMDDALDARARERGLRRVYLESWAEQIAALDATVGARDLAAAVHAYSSIRCDVADGRAAYLAGDQAVLDASLGGAQEATLVHVRNAAWLPRIEEQAARGRVLVVAGVAHMFGERGLPAELAARGWHVEAAR